MIKPLLTMMILFISCLPLTSSVLTRNEFCEDRRNATSVQIPWYGMPLSTFEKYWTNRLNHQVYYVWARQATSVIHIEELIQKTGSTTFNRTASGYSVKPPNSRCRNFTSEMTLRGRHNKAEFTVIHESWLQADKTSLRVFFSSCPDQYMWFLQCVGWVEGAEECPIADTIMALSVRTLDRDFTLPWDAASRDLRSVGLNFATHNLHFGLTYGENGIAHYIFNIS